MMKSEFIERVKFEPTAEEYVEIENEYMGCDIDKDEFCKMWKKNGGIERLMRLRARKIEELQAEIVSKDRLFDERTNADAIRYRELSDKSRAESQKLREIIENLKSEKEALIIDIEESDTRAKEAERKLAVLREAFEILGKEE